MLVSGIEHRQDAGLAPLVARAFDRAPGTESPWHCHPTAQLLYAVKAAKQWRRASTTYARAA